MIIGESFPRTQSKNSKHVKGYLVFFRERLSGGRRKCYAERKKRTSLIWGATFSKFGLGGKEDLDHGGRGKEVSPSRRLEGNEESDGRGRLCEA